jgi:putative transposase
VSGRGGGICWSTRRASCWPVVVCGAEVQDRAGGRLFAHAVRPFGPSLPRLALIGAAAADSGAFVEELREQFGWKVEIVKRSEEQPERGALQVLPYRWIVERSFGWLGGFHRLAKDDESDLESSEAMIYAAMNYLLLRRLAKHSPPASSPDG